MVSKEEAQRTLNKTILNFQKRFSQGISNGVEICCRRIKQKQRKSVGLDK
ncbi:hypothetical protein GCM10025861_27980 (plasmid) [Methanobacterium petrolearium]|nr:hypothetical protein GCM10025861_27980 [Methanobacterium petrolearium]